MSVGVPDAQDAVTDPPMTSTEALVGVGGEVVVVVGGGGAGGGDSVSPLDPGGECDGLLPVPGPVPVIPPSPPLGSLGAPGRSDPGASAEAVRAPARSAARMEESPTTGVRSVTRAATWSTAVHASAQAPVVARHHATMTMGRRIPTF